VGALVGGGIAATGLSSREKGIARGVGNFGGVYSEKRRNFWGRGRKKNGVRHPPRSSDGDCLSCTARR